MTDIEQLYTLEVHEKGAEMQVCNEFGEKLDMFLILKGLDSKAWRGLMSQASLKKLEGADEIEVIAESLSKITVGWRGFTSKGKELKFSKEKAKQLYMNAPYLQGQVDKFITDRKNFTKG